MATTTDIVLECQGLSDWFGSKRVLHDVNFSIIRGEIVALVGESGVGKSTILNAILGTRPPRQGSVVVRAAGQSEGYTVQSPGRDRGIVYQHYTLFPYLTAQENVAFGLLLDKTSIPYRLFHPRWRRLRKEYMDQAEVILDKVKLADALALYPHELSGGMRQRVALAQALIMEPEVLLLDEPFGALDEATREELQLVLLNLYAENCQMKKRGEPPKYTIVIVTHELNEALYVGDRVIALSPYWNWEQEGHPQYPGATVVYDDMAPVTIMDEERNFEAFAEQRRAIRAAAFDPEGNHARDKFHSFWSTVSAGNGNGVLRHEDAEADTMGFLRQPKTVSFDGEKTTKMYL